MTDEVELLLLSRAFSQRAAGPSEGGARSPGWSSSTSLLLLEIDGNPGMILETTSLGCLSLLRGSTASRKMGFFWTNDFSLRSTTGELCLQYRTEDITLASRAATTCFHGEHLSQNNVDLPHCSYRAPHSRVPSSALTCTVQTFCRAVDVP